MAFIEVKLTRIIDSSFPTFGEFEFVDASGEIVVILEKFLVVGIDEPMAESPLPIKGKMACSVISRSKVDVLIDIEKPDGIVDLNGRTRFQISADKLIE